jgi:homoserine kinase type II
MDEVFLLWHVHELSDGDDDEKLIGVYRTEDEAQAAIERVGQQPGFVDHPEGFQTCPYQLNSDNWTEGFVTVYPKPNL